MTRPPLMVVCASATDASNTNKSSFFMVSSPYQDATAARRHVFVATQA